MKKNIIQVFLLLASMMVLVACGTDQKENPVASNGTYSFFDATTPLKITKPSSDANGTVTGGDYEISVVLREFDLAKSDQVITMRPFESAYGFLAESSVTTDSNGRATFSYTAPSGSDFDAVRGQDITIQAIYADPEQIPNPTGPTNPDILLTQDFVLEFR